jgi:hypothetical protein
VSFQRFTLFSIFYCGEKYSDCRACKMYSPRFFFGIFFVLLLLFVVAAFENVCHLRVVVAA